MGDAAGNHINFVAFGYRNNHIGVLTTCALEHVGVRGVSGHYTNVDMVFEFAKTIGAGIDDRDVVGFVCQRFS